MQRKSVTKEVTQGTLLSILLGIESYCVVQRQEMSDAHVKPHGEVGSTLILDGKSRDTESTLKVVKHLGFCAS